MTFAPALAGETTIYFSADWPTGGVWTLAPSGAQPLTLLGGGTVDSDGNPVPSADHKITLSGNPIFGGVNAETIIFGTAIANFGLGVSIGSGARTITTVRGAGAGPDVQILGVLSSASIGSTLVFAGSASPAGSILLGNGSNSFNAPITVNAGTLLLGANATGAAGNTVLGQGSAQLLVGDTATTGQNAALLTYGPYTINRNITARAGNATGSITLGGAQTSGNSVFSGVVTFGKDTTLQALGSSEVAFTGTLQGDSAANVFIAGGGTVRLGGVNTYPGGTTVKTGGVAKITGSIAQTSGVAVEPGANLELAGTSGCLASGIPVANNGALLVSQPAVAGVIVGQGTTTVSSTLSAASVVQNTLTIGAGGSVTIRETTGGATTNVAAVPEPGAWALIGVGLLSVLAFCRRR